MNHIESTIEGKILSIGDKHPSRTKFGKYSIISPDVIDCTIIYLEDKNERREHLLLGTIPKRYIREMDPEKECIIRSKQSEYTVADMKIMTIEVYINDERVINQPLILRETAKMNAEKRLSESRPKRVFSSYSNYMANINRISGGYQND